MHRVSKSKTITIYLKFDTTLLEINLTFVLGYLSSILGELVNYFHKLYRVILIIRRVHMLPIKERSNTKRSLKFNLLFK